MMRGRVMNHMSDKDRILREVDNLYATWKAPVCMWVVILITFIVTGAII